jgi:hypothetical protein
MTRHMTRDRGRSSQITVSGALPDEVPYGAVVPVDHPLRPRRKICDRCPELLTGQRFPSWLVEDRVQFEMRDIHEPGESSRERALPRATVAHHRYASHAFSMAGYQYARVSGGVAAVVA